MSFMDVGSILNTVSIYIYILVAENEIDILPIIVEALLSH